MRWDIAVSIVIAAVLGVMVALPIIAVIKAQPAACAARWEPRETEYDRLSGCRVKINGAFVPEDNVRFGE